MLVSDLIRPMSEKGNMHAPASTAVKKSNVRPRGAWIVCCESRRSLGKAYFVHFASKHGQVLTSPSMVAINRSHTVGSTVRSNLEFDACISLVYLILGA